ncbi:MAG: hypothetical protein QOJ07_1002 [Thermoleophilaceae bacterium]|nr:hypothetical protein [Thermoleophilaceae bacterium]
MIDSLGLGLALVAWLGATSICLGVRELRLAALPEELGSHPALRADWPADAGVLSFLGVRLLAWSLVAVAGAVVLAGRTPLWAGLAGAGVVTVVHWILELRGNARWWRRFERITGLGEPLGDGGAAEPAYWVCRAVGAAAWWAGCLFAGRLLAGAFGVDVG